MIPTTGHEYNVSCYMGKIHSLYREFTLNCVPIKTLQRGQPIGRYSKLYIILSYDGSEEPIFNLTL